MASEQMGMPAAGLSPEEMAVYDQMRQNISPKEFSDEMLAGAAQVDPQAVAEFKQELASLDVTPEELEALNDVVDQILADPSQYPQLREQLLQEGVPADVLPEQFDPQFFAAMNMAVDQMLGLPAGPQAFAKGGIAELKPIAKALAGYGRNGDTMLAHITPAEARMLKRRGGSGTINPKTGLPEFFLKKVFKGVGKVFKSIGNAVKKFASSTVGRLVATVALGFFLGPAAASMLGVSSAAGVAAVSGFVGSAGSTLLAGGNLRDALKAGAVGGLTAGAGAAVMGGANAMASGSYTGPTTVSGQWDKFTNAVTPGAAPSATPTPATPAPNQPVISPTGQVPGMAPPPSTTVGGPTGADLDFFSQQYNQVPGGNPPPPGGPPPATTGSGPSYLEQAKDFYNKNISPSGIQEAAQPAAQEAGAKAMEALRTRVPTATPAMLESAYQTAYKNALPGIVGTYGPITAAGLGIMGVAGGFQSKPVQGGEISQSLAKPATQRIREGGTQRESYVQGLPGVTYDQYGEPIGNTMLPTYDVPSYGNPYGGYGNMQLPPIYTPPVGSIGSGAVYQPYNTASMYTNLIPKKFAQGGMTHGEDISLVDADLGSRSAAPAGATTMASTTAPATVAGPDNAAAAAAAAAKATIQKAAREEAARQRALRRAQGSANMYANINAGLSALAPQAFPGAPVTLTPERTQAIRTAYSGVAARPPAEVSDAERYSIAQRGGFRPEEIAAAFPGMEYGDVNRMMNRGAMLAQYAPMLQGQINALNTATRTMAPRPPAPVNKSPTPTPTAKADIYNFPKGTGGLLGPLTPAIVGAVTDPPYAPPPAQGIAALARGGYPRRTGQIDGPGTETSDSIPAMLSDGEFVMTAKAVRGAGKGSRREGAKRMYKLMHQLEKNAERG